MRNQHKQRTNRWPCNSWNRGVITPMNELQNLNLLWLKRITNTVLSINVSIIMSLNNEALNNIKCYIGCAPPIMSSKLIIDVIHFTVFVNIFFLKFEQMLASGWHNWWIKKICHFAVFFNVIFFYISMYFLFK